MFFVMITDILGARMSEFLVWRWGCGHVQKCCCITAVGASTFG